MPYHLAMSPYSILCNTFFLNDSYGNRTRVTAVKGRCLNRLTKEPYFFFSLRLSLSFSPGFLPDKKRAPRVGLEPTTLRLTAECSTIELSRIIILDIYIPSKLHTDSLNFFPFGQALDRLVTVSSIHCCTSTSALST